MPARARAPLRNTLRVIRFNPEISATECIMMMSRVPTYGRVMPEAMVEIITFGRPNGNARITAVPSDVPMDPPTPITPEISPRRYRSCAQRIAPSIMTAWHLPS